MAQLSSAQLRSTAGWLATPRAFRLRRTTSRPGPRGGSGDSGAPGSPLWRRQHCNSSSRLGQRTAAAPFDSDAFWIASGLFFASVFPPAFKKYDEWSAAQRQQTGGSAGLAGGSAGSGDANSGPNSGMHGAQEPRVHDSNAPFAQDKLASGSSCSSGPNSRKLEQAAMLAAEKANLSQAVLVCMEALKQQLAATEARAASAEAAEVESLKKEVKRLTKLTQELESEAGLTAAE